MRNYLNSCLKIEQVMGEVYRRLAAVERYSSAARDTFARLAQDEAEHARQLEMARGVPENLFFAGARLEPRQLDELLRRAQRLLQLATDPPGSEQEMLETARDLEREFIQVHLHNAVQFRDPEVVALFQNLAHDDEAHMATLDACCCERRPRPETRH